MMLVALVAYLTDIGTAISVTANGFGQHTFWLTAYQVSRALIVCILLSEK